MICNAPESLTLSNPVWQQQLYSSELNLEQALLVANRAIFARVGRALSQVETAVLQGAWQSQTYEQIAEAAGYSVSYLTRDVGPKFWKLLSKALGETVSKTNFRSALERQLKGDRKQRSNRELLIQNPSDVRSALKVRPEIQNQADWGDASDISLFCGRTSDLATLTQWIQVDHCRLLALFGMVGVGKTSLAVKLAERVQHEFDFVIWRSLSYAPSLETLVSDLVSFLSKEQVQGGDIRQLIQCLRNSRCLLILDGVEAIMQPGNRAGRYRPGYEGYSELFREIGESVHQSCLILTSREKPADVATVEGIESSVRSWQLSGSVEAAHALIRAKGLLGSTEHKQQLCDRYGCNPLLLKIVATSIQDLFDGKIGKFLEQDTTVFNGLRRLLNKQFERLSPLEKTIMYRLAMKREWMTISELAADIVPSVSKADLMEALQSLSWRSLIEKQSGSYTLQPVVMEYVTDQLSDRIAA